jgi:hypothetical protein
MAQTGFTPIQLYFSSTTTNVPLAANLASGELAINITDGKLFYKDNANAVQVIGWKVVPATAGGTGQTSYAVGDLIYADTTTTLAKLPDVATGNALISGGVGVAPSWGKIGLTTHVSGTLPTANGGTNLTSFTANGIVYASSSSALATGSALTFDGTNFVTTGSITASQTTGYIGTTTNNNASAGSIGEFVSSTVASNGVSMTSTTAVDVTSISLTAGDWDVSGVVGITNTLGTTTYSFINYGSSTTSATVGTLGQMGSLTPNSNISATVDFVAPIPTTRYSLSATTTIYLIARAGFAVSNSFAYGVIRARRVR